MRNEPVVAIVGAGVAGLAAADLLARHRVPTLMVDENPFPGGRFLGNAARTSRKFPLAGGMEKEAAALLSRLSSRDSISLMSGTQAVGFFEPETLLVASDSGGLHEVRTSFLVLATGARERFLPFPGWTLPGVFSTGAVQILIEHHGVLPARRFVVAGKGPLPLKTARLLAGAGCGIRGFFLESTPTGSFSFVPHLFHLRRRVMEGLFWGVELITKRVLPRFGYRILEARGKNRVEEVVVGRIPRSGTAFKEEFRTIRTDAVAVGHGFSANVELPAQAGCALGYDARLGGWHVAVDENMETSLPDVFAAGEITGIGGAAKSIIEGRLSAATILLRLGRLSPQEHHRMKTMLLQARRRELNFGRILNAWCRTDLSLYKTLPNETIVCRCEEVSLGEIKNAVREGHEDLHTLKKRTRCGMGRCQGRICGPILMDIFCTFTGRSPEDAGPLSVRPPVKPVSLDVLAGKE